MKMPFSSAAIMPLVAAASTLIAVPKSEAAATVVGPILSSTTALGDVSSVPSGFASGVVAGDIFEMQLDILGDSTAVLGSSSDFVGGVNMTIDLGDLSFCVLADIDFTDSVGGFGIDGPGTYDSVIFTTSGPFSATNTVTGDSVSMGSVRFSLLVRPDTFDSTTSTLGNLADVFPNFANSGGVVVGSRIRDFSGDFVVPDIGSWTKTVPEPGSAFLFAAAAVGFTLHRKKAPSSTTGVSADHVAPAEDEPETLRF